MKRKQKSNSKILLAIGVSAIIVLIVLMSFIAKDMSAPSAPSTSFASDAQELRMTASYRGYEPSSFTVQSGKPVRWIINGGSSMGCASTLTAPKLGVTKLLSAGENVIEFTAPTTPGTYPFSCSMNMYRGSITVT